MELVIAFLEGIFSVSALKQRLHCVLTPMNEEQRTSLQLSESPVLSSGTFQSCLLILDNLLFHHHVLFRYDLIFNYPTKYLECSTGL